MPDAIVTTDDRVLGGQLLLRQPASGHRAGHDAILLAAATSARSGQRVVDFGAGVGTAGLAVAKRVAGLSLGLIEVNPDFADLARHNAEANGLKADVITLDLASSADTFAAAGLLPDSADVVLMNPPFNDPARHRASPDKTREIAHVAAEDTLATWIHAARRVLKSNGELTLIWRADGVADVLAALDRGFGALALMPVHGDASAPAIRILARAVKGGRAPAAIHPGIALRDAKGAPDAHIQQILEGHAALPWASL
ncbi:methyltransferase [Tardiphaga alba]|uniref:Methyltransferase n=2 Tax=Tardiphaga alba TaxID=340268 RepID=A0ABX8AFK6_9BRAD|nr:methyltransferase [Tardiphaga alba]QUS42563.1 methyltransferase [Tardiphaga alba]